MDFTLPNGPGDHKSALHEAARHLEELREHNDRVGALSPNHLAELRASGLTDDTIAANGIYSESDPKAVAKLLNWGATRARMLGSALVYPHYDRDGTPLGHATVKPDHPRDRTDKPGKVKYENPRQRPTRLYIPAGARAALINPTALPLLIVFNASFTSCF